MARARIHGTQHRSMPPACSSPKYSLLTLILLFLSSSKPQTATGFCSTASFDPYFNSGVVPEAAAFIPPSHVALSTQFTKHNNIHSASRFRRRRSRGGLGVDSMQRRRCQIMMANPEGTQQLRDRDLEFMFYDEAEVRHVPSYALDSTGLD